MTERTHPVQCPEVLEGLPDGVFLATRDRILLANSALLEILGLDRSDVVGSAPDDYFHLKDRSWILERIAEALRPTSTEDGSSAPGGDSRRVRMLQPEGEWRSVTFATIRAVECEGEAGVLCLIQDRAETAQALAERDRAQAQYLSIFKNSPLGVLLIDGDGVVVQASPAAAALLKADEESLSGTAFLELMHEQDRQKVEFQLDALLDGTLPKVALDSSLQTLHRTHVPVRLHISKAEGPYALDPLVVCLLEDISERKALEHQLRTVARIESIGRLAGGIAHDFNNLVTVINGHAEMLLAETPESDLRHSDLTEILNAGERAAALTNQLLAFSRRTVQESTILDVNEVVQGLRSILERTLGEDVRFVLDLGDLEHRALADQSQLEQVILNLAVNARDAMPRGGTLTLRTRDWVMDQTFTTNRPGSVPGDYLRVTVEDTGVGMSDEVLHHIFEPFFTTKAPGSGTGLGLATVYGIVKQTQAYVDVESTPGEGTTFHVYLPASDLQSADEPERAGIPTSGGSETILLVEDEEAVRSLAQRILGLQGYRVFTASNGEEGLRLARQIAGKLDLLVTDVIMPVLGGRELAERLQEHQPGLKTLFISGYPDDALLRYGMERGKVQLLYKPFTAGEFARRVRGVLDQPAKV